jgi:aspartate/methionine/tyrosine aminotransferase
VTFSRRTAWPRATGQLASRIDAARAAGWPLVDLAESNPTRCGLADPATVALLGDARGAAYEPASLGLRETREAVAAYYARHGRSVGARQIVLGASTSEAYSWAFKLLCDPGDRVLVPRPSYPLFPYLADMEAVGLASYPLMREEGWRIDFDTLEKLADDRTRAILCVHPGNPTGSLVHKGDAERLVRLCRKRDLALVADEVFLDYALEPAPDRCGTFAGEEGCLTLVLSGLSKVALLPQLKLGWMVVSGRGADEALARLEVVADSYLSVSTPVQLATPAILAAAVERQKSVRARLLANLAALDATIAAHPSCPVRRLPVDAGWYALVEIPRTRSDDAWAELLLEEEGLVVHPGWFFDMSEAGTMVVSLLLEPAVFADAIGRAVARWVAG